MPTPEKSSQPQSQAHTIGEQIGAFRALYGAADEKRWHDCFHIIFGRGISYADEGAVSIAEQAFTNKLTGMPYNPKAVAMMYQEEFARDYDLEPSELGKRLEAIGQIGLDAAERLKAHWGDLPALHDHEDFWARSLPEDWSLTLPSIAGAAEPEYAINRDALSTLISRDQPVTKADRQAVFESLASESNTPANDRGMGAPAVPINSGWQSHRYRASAQRRTTPTPSPAPKR